MGHEAVAVHGNNQGSRKAYVCHLTNKMKILLYDHGLNTEIGIKLAQAGHTVGYFSEWREAFPRCVNESVGKGLEGLERVDNFLTAAERSDLICCFDTNSSDIVQHMRSIGKRCFGAGKAEKLELDRSFTKQVLLEAGLAIGKYRKIKGVDNLIDYLRKEKDKWVKIDGQFRGDNETFHHSDWQKTMAGELGALLMSFGARSNEIEFLVEDPLDSKCEVGYDGFYTNGRFTDGLVGYESKDKSYVAVFRKYNEMPFCLRDTNEKIKFVFQDAGPTTATIFSTELRLTNEKEYYLIDPCVRAPHPPTAAELEHFENFAECVLDGTNPIPSAKYSCVVEVKSDELREHWCEVEFAYRYRHLVKLARACRIDKTFYALPGSPIACNVVGLGNTFALAKAECIKVLDTVKVPGMSYDLDSLDLLEEETIPTGEKHGIKF